ncbi:Protein spt3 [Diplodia seriata]|uniref:Protein spt3 n=1 Tax=Diplodia seriata TaxID=420778 RepID=A0A1S8B5G0_9PEZI|nr:Protein spt3 [Diplodia seriata]
MTDQYRAEIQQASLTSSIISFRHAMPCLDVRAHHPPQMMFVAGEAGDIPPETTSVVEHIVQQQVIELLSRADALASRRGGGSSRLISTDDLIFLVRDDAEKVSRLLHFLAWKELRKSAKDRDDDDAIDAVDDADADDDVRGLPPDETSSSSRTKTKGAATASKAAATAAAVVVLPWDVENLYTPRPPAVAISHDHAELEQGTAAAQQQPSDPAHVRRLQLADQRTRGMTRQQYAAWSEARQASSFTRRKKAKFRQWSGLGTSVTDARVQGEDVVDVLGWLAFQMVVALTEGALRVKGAEEAVMMGWRDGGAAGGRRGDEGGSEGDGAGAGAGAGGGLFAAALDGGGGRGVREAVGPGHVREAFRRLQRGGGGKGAVVGAMGARPRRPLRLVSVSVRGSGFCRCLIGIIVLVSRGWRGTACRWKWLMPGKCGVRGF